MFFRRMLITHKLDKMTKFTTAALAPNQHLKPDDTGMNRIEAYMIGFTDNKRDKKLDGWYIRKSITAK